MSGARLEANGQVRHAFPYIVNEGFRVNLTLTVANGFVDRQPIAFTGQLPFDIGPDKSGRVFLLINGVYIAVRVDAGTTTNLRGALYFQGLDGRKVYLQSFSQTVSTVGSAFPGGSTLIVPPQTITADKLSPLGYLGFEDNGSTIGTATEIDLANWFNIGFYGDYSEPNWKELFDVAKHEHTGLSAFRESE